MAAPSTYKYVPPSGSLLFRYVLNPIYSQMVHCLPRWLTPNAMTVVGITLTGLASAMMMKHFHEGTEISKEELYVVSAFNLLYMCLDNLDGKQARRLKLSSPIGEYLDHGGDCWTSLLSIWCCFKLAGVAECDFTLMTLVLCTSIVHLFHLGTGQHTLGGDLFSADEGMIAFCAVPLLWALTPETFSLVVYTNDEYGLSFTVAQICTIIFFLGQLACALELVRALGTATFHPVFLHIVLSAVLMTLVRDGSVCWALTAAMVASFGIHYLIAASCMGIKQLGAVRTTPLLATVTTALPLAFGALPEHRPLVCGAAVVLHLLQVLYNCDAITKEKARKSA
eukprot:TRINITY_DN30042_c0_g1_i1.p1 TRINITY_DN30042_c0_g1~~TRINITY_DN30042_c0_g1_i1.p1  ORF type:complete len:355 (+),score=128.99 TRINITY_DN30042_c0_g1_i1:53-1066(+)